MHSVVVAKPTLTPDQVLRSVNIVFDADCPERIAHFFPTAKTARLVSRLFRTDDNSSYIVVAPYGSGKSLTATFYLQLLENVPSYRPILSQVISRFHRVDPELSGDLFERLSPSQGRFFDTHGIVVALNGYQQDLPAAIHRGVVDSLKRTGLRSDALRIEKKDCKSMDAAVQLLSHIRDSMAPQPVDKIAIVWDEFGRHLEELVSHGSASALNDVQILAEFAARTRKITTSLTLLLHQGLMRYASNVSVSVQQEWKKIEGRFETVQFVDDSKELYQLVSEIVSRHVSPSTPAEHELTVALQRCRETGLFSDSADDELRDILAKAYPLEPVALFLLPRVSSRVAQNERTLFTFLYDLRTEGLIGPDRVFDYFSDQMRSDTFVGGTYHAWLETQSALTRIESLADAKTLKCACLLSLGLVGERSRVSRKLLSYGVAGYGPIKDSEKSISRLIDSKLLLFRRNTDSVSVWHGADIDLRGKLEEEKRRVGHSFDLVEFLEKEVPAPTWKPVEHNSTFHVERYFDSRYISVQALLSPSFSPVLAQGPNFSDGTIYFVVPETEQDLDELREWLRNKPTIHDRTVICAPRKAEHLFDVALEVRALGILSDDSALLAEDPLIAPELAQMIDDAQGYMGTVLDRLYTPSPDGPDYFHVDRFIRIESRRDLRSYLSLIMDHAYPLTPKINNELIVRNKPRPVIVNSRKKLLLGVLERSGTESLGIDGYRPDMSMFRTVLLHPGLYRRTDQGGWKYAQPNELTDPGLAKIWDLFQKFLTNPRNERKSFEDLFAKLRAEPFGLRAGVLPILLAAALRAFPSALSLTKPDGAYLPDILPSVIEEICQRPGEYFVTVVGLDATQTAYLEGVYRLFSPSAEVSVQETDPLRRCYDALIRWRENLPLAAFTSTQFSNQTQAIQKLLLREPNPFSLFMHGIPAELACDITNWETIVRQLQDSKSEIEDVVSSYYAAAKRSLLSALQFETHDIEVPLVTQVKQWADCFPPGVETALSEGIARAFLNRARIAYRDDRSLIDSLCSLTIGKGINRWDDSTLTLFDREVHGLVNRIESSLLSDSSHISYRSSTTGTAKLAIARFNNMYRTLVGIVGPDEARRVAHAAADDQFEHQE